MLTRKPSAAAPAAYPTGKEARAPLPPPAPGPALVAPAPAASRTSNKVCAVTGRRGVPRVDGAPSPQLIVNTRAPRLLGAEPSGWTGAVPDLPRLGLGDAAAPGSAVQSRSGPTDARRVDRRPGSARLPGGVANSLARGEPYLTVQPPEPRPRARRAWTWSRSSWPGATSGAGGSSSAPICARRCWRSPLVTRYRPDPAGTAGLGKRAPGAPRVPTGRGQQGGGRRARVTLWSARTRGAQILRDRGLWVLTAATAPSANFSC